MGEHAVEFPHRLSAVRHMLKRVTTINEVEGVIWKLEVGNIHGRTNIRFQKVCGKITPSDHGSKFLLQYCPVRGSKINDIRNESQRTEEPVSRGSLVNRKVMLIRVFAPFRWFLKYPEINETGADRVGPTPSRQI